SEDPLRTEWLLHRMEEYSRNWSGIAAYAIAGIELALLDIKGKALGAPVAELLGGLGRERVPVIGYLFIDEPEANARKAADYVEAGHAELKLKVGRDLTQDYDTLAAIRDRVGYDVKIRIDANMNWSVPRRSSGSRRSSSSTCSSPSSRCPTSTSRGWRPSAGRSRRRSRPTRHARASA